MMNQPRRQTVDRVGLPAFWLALGLLVWAGWSTAEAQIYRPPYYTQPPYGGPQPPEYGYHATQWRRWPGETYTSPRRPRRAPREEDVPPSLELPEPPDEPLYGPEPPDVMFPGVPSLPDEPFAPDEAVPPSPPGVPLPELPGVPGVPREPQTDDPETAPPQPPLPTEPELPPGLEELPAIPAQPATPQAKTPNHPPRPHEAQADRPPSVDLTWTETRPISNHHRPPKPADLRPESSDLRITQATTQPTTNTQNQTAHWTNPTNTQSHWRPNPLRNQNVPKTTPASHTTPVEQAAKELNPPMRNPLR